MLGEQGDRLATRRQLQGAERDGFADQLERRRERQARTVEAEADAVGIGCDLEFG